MRILRHVRDAAPPASSGRPVRRLLALAAIVVALLSGSSLAADRPADSSAPGWGWDSVCFTHEDGLPGDCVLGVVETASGVPYAVTPDRLARYDGFRWAPLGAREGLPRLRDPILSPAGGENLLLVTGRRLYRGDGKRFREIPVSPEGHRLAVLSAVSSGEAAILAAAFDEGAPAARLFEIRDGEVSEVPPPVPGGLTGEVNLVRTHSGRVFVSSDSGLFLRTGEGWRDVFGGAPPGFRLGALQDGPAGDLTVGISLPMQLRGLWQWEGGRPRRVDPTGGVTSLDVSSGGAAIATEVSGGVLIRDGEGWKRLFGTPAPFHGVTCLCYRQGGDLWVGTEQGLYLCFRRPRQWRAWPAERSDATVNDILKASDGSVWVATGAGVERHRPDGELDTPPALGNPDVFEVTGLGEDPAGAIWLVSGSGFEGAWRWDGRELCHYGPAEGLDAGYIHRIGRDRDGRLWFLGLTRPKGDPRPGGPGVFLRDGDRFRRWEGADGLSSGRVYAFAEGGDGAYWFGTAGGLDCYRNRRWRHWATRDGLPTNRIFSLAVDHEGCTWFAQQADGLGYVDRTNHLHRVTKEDGLPSNVVWEVRVGPDGRLWATTWRGIWVRRGEESFTIGRPSGLTSLRNWPILPTGDRIYVGGLEGLRVREAQPERDPLPRVWISDPAVESDHALLRWTAAAWWGRPGRESLETRWRFDGGPWSSWSTIREVRPQALPAGEHRLEVQARGLFGRYDPRGAARSFSVPLPLFFRPKVYVPVLSLLLGLICLATISIVRHGRYVSRLRQSEERSRRFFEEDLTGDFVSSADGRLVLCNPAFARMFGFPSPLAATKASTWLYYRRPEDRLALIEELVTRGRLENREISLVRQDGSPIHVIANLNATFGPDGELAQIQGYLFDITERRALEDQLRQSQKMEAVGRLAGGVAHDFNNLLTVIRGYSDLLLSARKLDGDARPRIEEISRAANRAANLTRQLLAFSRRQVLEPRVLDLNLVLAEMKGMLGQLIGDRVTLETVMADGLDPILVDPTQLEQVVVNLVVNARDAMPGGGRIRLETANVEVSAADAADLREVRPGSYVRLRVSDTGDGMTPDVRARVFEPFFTTKALGQGTGLGLATLYGIVKQSGGGVEVRSEIGVGTTFAVHFPAHPSGDDAPPPSDRTAVVTTARKACETILIAEDEDGIRSLAEEALTTAGYRVRTAPDGREALARAGEEEHVDLLLTDVRMPHLGGPELATRLRARWPGIKVLFISGYTDSGAPDADGSAFLPKPFSVDELLDRTRALLDG